MKINNNFIQNTPAYKTKPSQQTAFSGLKLSKKFLNDVFLLQNQLSNKGLKSLKNIRSGEFGTVCKGSIPLKPFWAHFDKHERLKLKHIGLSTNADGFPRSFLKSSADKPLSTSLVHSCSVMYLYNKPTNTHFLYHASEEVPKSELGYMVKNFMPEGCTHAIIKPGDGYWSDVHKITLPEMFDAIRQNATDAIINVYHDSTKYPEIVGYKGMLYEIPNRDVLLQNNINPEDYGQASFTISDIQGFDTIDAIKYDAFNRESIEELKKKFAKNSWDIEMKKVVNKILEGRETVIEEIEDCKTPQELESFLTSHDKSFAETYWRALAEKRKSFTLKQNKSKSHLICHGRKSV